MFPYNFQKIPILLISNLYEKFLESGRRSTEGIVFTPQNVVNLIFSDSVFQNKSYLTKIKSKNIKILDPSCGSGVFLVKIFESIIELQKEQKGEELTLEEKSNILLNSIYGIDIDERALRIAAFSLYLKLLEDEDIDTIKDIFRKYEKHEEHFMFPGLVGHNLLCKDTLLDEFDFDKKFDAIVGNPPWGYKFSDIEKAKLKRKWPLVSDFQSSQYFMLRIGDWIKNDGIGAMVVNLSNFTNSNASDFRQELLNKFNLSKLISLKDVKQITFKEGEPATIIIFKNGKSKQLHFVNPDMCELSRLTEQIVIKNNDIVKCSKRELKNDETWHQLILGFGNSSGG